MTENRNDAPLAAEIDYLYHTSPVERRIYEQLDEIADKQTRIQQALEGYRDTDAAQVTWAHVGSLAHVSELLSEVAEFLGVSDEQG